VTYESIKNDNMNHVWFTAETDDNIKNIFLKKIPKLLGVEILNITLCKWQMVIKKEQVEVHIDESDTCDLQTIFYIKGHSFLNSGTGFYTHKENSNKLSTIVGFEPNRLVSWDSNTWHGPLSHADDFTSRISIITQYKIRK